MPFKNGDRFTCYKDVQLALQNYEKETFSKYSKRDSRTIGKSRVNKYINPNLIYYEMKFACKHGGKPFRSNGKGIKQTSTFKKDCPAYVRIKVSQDGQTLEVVDVNEEHKNHDQNEVSFAHYPEERRLPDEIRNEAKDLLAMKANKKLVQEKMQVKSGKVITFRDLSNIQATVKEGKKDDLESCIEFLRQEGYDVHVLRDDEDNFKGMLIQNDRMKELFAAYPEFAAIDATYKLLKMSIPTYLILIEDGNCQSEIVAMCLLVNEDKDSLAWFLETFKNTNPSSENTKCIMTDKDLSERSVIREIFPNASLIICIFHVQRTFDREVTCQKMGITQSQRNTCLEFFQKMVYAKSDEFEEVEKEFEDYAPKAVLEYYHKNWKNIRDEWNVNENFVQSNFLNNTNNRLECANSKLKSVISKNSTLRSFLEGFLTIINSLAQDRSHKATYSSQKRLVLKYPPESDEYKYSEYLTKEATIHVLDQLEASNFIVSAEPENHSFNIEGYPGLKVTETDCSCLFRIAMCLPCKHIFAVRKFLDLPQFDPNLILERWTLGYLKKNHPAFKSASVENNNNALFVTIQRNVCPLSYAQKRKKAHIKSDESGDLCALRTGEAYEKRLKTLDTLNMYWKNGIEVAIIPLKTELADINCVRPDGIRTLSNQVQQNSDFENVGENVSTPEKSIQGDEDSVLENDEEIIDGTLESERKKVISSISGTLSVSTIKMPVAIKNRGRPKGRDVTVIGLPKNKSKLTPYYKKHFTRKQDFILKLVVRDASTVETAVKKDTLIEKEQLELRAEKVPHSILDQQIDIKAIRSFLTHDAYDAVLKLVNDLKEKDVWICDRCNDNIGNLEAIVCTGCLLWRHLSCVNLKSQPKAKNWFCRDCRRSVDK